MADEARRKVGQDLFDRWDGEVTVLIADLLRDGMNGLTDVEGLRIMAMVLARSSGLAVAALAEQAPLTDVQRNVAAATVADTLQLVARMKRSKRFSYDFQQLLTPKPSA